MDKQTRNGNSRKENNSNKEIKKTDPRIGSKYKKYDKENIWSIDKEEK